MAKTTILKNILKYYNLFAPLIEKQLQQAKSSIDKELKEFIAIQRWKDINFYARKEASARIRRQLFKFVKSLQVKQGLAYRC